MRHDICTPICCDLGSAARPLMELHCACALAAHEPEFHRWMAGDHPRKRQTSTASPAEPGELPLDSAGPSVAAGDSHPAQRTDPVARNAGDSAQRLTDPTTARRDDAIPLDRETNDSLKHSAAGRWQCVGAYARRGD